MTTPQQPVKILLVDDLEDNLLVLEALLRRDDLTFLKARSGREALELLLTHDVALALLDLHMPEMDGFELAELMRGSQRTRHVPIIFVTAGARDMQRMFRGYEVGAVDFLFKPIDPVLLGHKVSTFVELHRQKLELREMLRVNEMFVAAVSHDLRSPLSTIVMGASLLDREITEPNSKRTIARMRSSAQRMNGILEQLFDLAHARLGGGGVTIDPHETNFRTLAEKVVEELRLAHAERSVVMKYDASSPVGVWDEQRLGQVVANLVGNAMRHGTRGTEIVVRLTGDADSVTFEVHNGGDIPEAIRPHLFDPFRRGLQKSRDSLGLGLYIVQQIVLSHGGTIDVESSAEAGTTFRVKLPRIAPAQPSHPDTKEETPLPPQ